MGSDIAMPTYNTSTMLISSANATDAGVTVTSATGGVFTTYNTDSDKFTVTASGGSASGLVALDDVNGDLAFVYRNAAAAANTLTFTTSATPGSGFTSNLAGISVDGAGAVTISAGSVDLGDATLGIGGAIRVQNLLTSLTLHDANSYCPNSVYNLAHLTPNALILARGQQCRADLQHQAGRLVRQPRYQPRFDAQRTPSSASTR